RPPAAVVAQPGQQRHRGGCRPALPAHAGGAWRGAAGGRGAHCRPDRRDRQRPRRAGRYARPVVRTHGVGARRRNRTWPGAGAGDRARPRWRPSPCAYRRRYGIFAVSPTTPKRGHRTVTDTIWIADDDANVRFVLGSALRDAGYEV